MTGIFCGSVTTSDEEFKKVIKSRIILQGIMCFLGLATFGIVLFLRLKESLLLADYLQGVYTGVGSGLFGSSLVLLIKNVKLLKNPEKLHKTRITNTDERLIAINQIAIRVATVGLLIAMYIVAFVVGIKNPEMMNILFGLVCLFLVIYIVAYKIIQKKM
jgi:hypothetical protein